MYVASPFFTAINKVFADSYYVPEMSKTDFDYQVVSLKESFQNINIENASIMHMR